MAESYSLEHRPEALAGGTLPGGREWIVYRDVFTYRMLIGRPDLGWGDDVYDFLTLSAAVEAGELWDGEGEPSGWHRHPPSGRRRPDGDPLREYTRDPVTGRDRPSGANPEAGSA